MADYTPKLRKNGQVIQPNVEFPPEGNGWPDPLTDDSDQVRQQVTVGRNGESIMQDGINTSQTKTGGWHLAEGDSSAPATQPDTTADESVTSGNPLQTSQQKQGGHHLPEGE